MYKPGDLIFVRPNGLLFNLVRYFTSGKYGHVGIVAGYIEGHVLIIEATKHGIDQNDLIWRKVKKEKFDIYRIQCIDDEKRRELVVKCLSYVGLPYDKKAWLNFIIGSTAFGTDKKMYCSEMIYRALVDLEIVKSEYHPEKITPANLHKLLNKQITRVM